MATAQEDKRAEAPTEVPMHWSKTVRAAEKYGQKASVTYTVNSGELRRLSQLLQLMSKCMTEEADSGRPVLEGIYIQPSSDPAGAFRLVATDGFVVGIVEPRFDAPFDGDAVGTFVRDEETQSGFLIPTTHVKALATSLADAARDKRTKSTYVEFRRDGTNLIVVIDGGTEVAISSPLTFPQHYIDLIVMDDPVETWAFNPSLLLAALKVLDHCAGRAGVRTMKRNGPAIIETIEYGRWGYINRRRDYWPAVVILMGMATSDWQL